MHPETSGRTGRLDPLTREIIALAVSATNGCAYCVNSHTAAVRKLGLDAEALGELMAIVGLFNSTNAIADGYQIRAGRAAAARLIGRPADHPWPFFPCGGWPFSAIGSNSESTAAMRRSANHWIT